MGDLTLGMVQLVEQLIDAKAPGRITAMGTVVTRSGSFSDPRLTVALDWSAAAVPARAFGNVWCRPGDRVGLVRFGNDWVVVGSYTAPVFGFGVVNADATTGNTTSGTFVALPNSASLTITKVWDETAISVHLFSSADSDTNNTAIEMGIAFAGTTYAVAQRFYSTASVRGFVGGTRTITGLAAGTYTAGVQWRRVSGSGTLRQFAGGDWTSAVAIERP